MLTLYSLASKSQKDQKNIKKTIVRHGLFSPWTAPNSQLVAIVAIGASLGVLSSGESRRRRGRVQSKA